MNRTRLTTSVATAVALASITTGVAGAQVSPTVTATVGSGGTRQLVVSDLLGNPLTDIALSPRQATAFRVSVRDTAPTGTVTGATITGYDVRSQLTNLYRVTGTSTYDYATRIPSSAVTASFASSPLDLSGLTANLQPRVLLNGTATCAKVTTALALNAAAALTDPLCLLLGTTTTTVTDVPLVTAAIEGIDLSSLATSALPIVPGTGASGAYTEPDCANGIGGGDTACTTAGATQRTFLKATPATTLGTDLMTLLTASLPAAATPIASADGSGALATSAAVVQALVSSSDASVSALGQKLATYTPAQQATLLNALLTATRSGLSTADLTGVAGLFTSFPMLSLSSPSVPAGSYSGTLTITLVDGGTAP